MVTYLLWGLMIAALGDVVLVIAMIRWTRRTQPCVRVGSKTGRP